MLPVSFEGCNIVLDDPTDIDDDHKLSDVPAFFGVDADKRYIFIVAWQPNKDDLDSLNAGRPVFVKMFTDNCPPSSVFTLDEFGKPND